MEELVFFASTICFVFIQICSAFNAELMGNLSLPVDCSEGIVYPWFDQCNKYIQCNGTKPTIQCCQGKSNPGEKLTNICSPQNKEGSCGYINCTNTITKVVAFRSPNNTKTPFYGLCVNGIIISQGICRTGNNNLSMIFDEETGSCMQTCNEGDIIEHPDCSKWSECVDNKIIVHQCPDGANFNGSICSFNYECPTNNTSTTTTTTTPLPTTTASPTTTPTTTGTPTITTTPTTTTAQTATTTPIVTTTTTPTTTTTTVPTTTTTLTTTVPTTTTTPTTTVPTTTTTPTTTVTTTTPTTTTTTVPTTTTTPTTTVPTTTTTPTTTVPTTPTTPTTTRTPITTRRVAHKTTPRRFSVLIKEDIL